MNILFLTICKIHDLKYSDIYTDLMKQFVANGHDVYIVAPFERRMKQQTSLYESDGAHFLGVKTLNIQRTNIIEKGVGTLLIESQFKNAVKKYFGHIKFDLVTYSTPPITFSNVIEYVKKRDGAKSFLQLKDIFPQNAVDLGIFGKNSPFYWYFRKKEKQLYKFSDVIGCMSPANIEYVIKHNLDIPREKVIEAPNSIEIVEHPVVDKMAVRKHFNLPLDKIIFLYDGNLGKTQGIEFFVECLNKVKDCGKCHFVIIGSGTDSVKIDSWISKQKPKNVTRLEFLPKEEYYKIIRSCDVGLIFLDYRFTIPNYPSRMLPYMEYNMPFIAATDTASDVGTIAEKEGFGYWCPSNDSDAFAICIDRMLSSDISEMGKKANNYLKEHYDVKLMYNTIINSISE